MIPVPPAISSTIPVTNNNPTNPVYYSNN